MKKIKETYIFRAEIFVNSQKETIFAPQLQKRWNNDFILKTKKIIAKIAQLVEHDLAKVGVAGSSPVFRSNIRILPGWWNGRHEGLKILWLHGCAGSSPASGTYKWGDDFFKVLSPFLLLVNLMFLNCFFELNILWKKLSF